MGTLALSSALRLNYAPAIPPRTIVITAPARRKTDEAQSRFTFVGGGLLPTSSLAWDHSPTEIGIRAILTTTSSSKPANEQDNCFATTVVLLGN
jgi:hypothetical protein